MSSQEVIDQFNTAFRDFVVDGVPSSGANPPNKGQIRAIGPLVGALQGRQTVAALAGSHIAASVLQVVAAGLTTVGDLASGSAFRRVSGQPIYAGSWFRSQDIFLPDGTSDPVLGGYWIYVPDARGVNAHAFGVVADASVTRYPWAVSGTDNTAAFQNAVNFSIYSAKVPVYFRGRVRITRGIEAGWGETFVGMTIEGDGPMFRAEGGGFGGSALILDATKGYAINVQGARFTRLRSFAILGRNISWTEHNHMMATLDGNLIDDLVLANWPDPALDPQATARYTPLAGVVIDARSGVQPATHYDNLTFPSYTGITTQYGGAGSSKVVLEDMYIGGFVAGVAVKPSNDDSNGDFTTVQNSSMEHNIYHLSVGNTQSRNVGMKDVSCAVSFAALASDVHGKQQGKFGGPMSNCQFASTVKVFQMTDATIAGPIEFVSCYGELVWSLGYFGSGGATTQTMDFLGCQWSFGAQTTKRGRPPYVIECVDGARITFRGGSLESFLSVLSFGGKVSDYELDNVLVTPAGASVEAARPNLYERYAQNALSGGVVFTGSLTNDLRPPMANIAFQQFDVVANTQISNLKAGDVWASSRALPRNIYSRWLTGAENQNFRVPNPRCWSSINKSSFSSLTLVDDLLTGTFSSRADEAFLHDGPLPGDILIDNTTGSVFFVKSRVGTTFTAKLQNNFNIRSGVMSYFNAFSTSVGSMFVCNTRIFCAQYYLRADLDSTSPILLNVGRDDGFCSWIDTELAPGDIFWCDNENDRDISLAQCVVSARNGTAKTITLAGNPNRTVVRKQIQLWASPGPANV